MNRSFYDIDPAGEVLCTYTGVGEQEKLRSVSAATRQLAGAAHPSLSLPCHSFGLSSTS